MMSLKPLSIHLDSAVFVLAYDCALKLIEWMEVLMMDLLSEYVILLANGQWLALSR